MPARNRDRERNSMGNTSQSRGNHNQSRPHNTLDSGPLPSFSREQGDEPRIHTIRLFLHASGSLPCEGSNHVEHASLCLLTGDRSWVHMSMTQRRSDRFTGRLCIQYRDDEPPRPRDNFHDIRVERPRRISEVTSIILDENRLVFRFRPDGAGSWLWVLVVVWDLQDMRVVASSSLRDANIFVRARTNSGRAFESHLPGLLFRPT